MYLCTIAHRLLLIYILLCYHQLNCLGIPPVDPDTIFAEVQTCSLEEIFGRVEGRFGKYSRRTSSAKWEFDEISMVEKRKYRNVMGYAAGNSPNNSNNTAQKL